MRVWGARDRRFESSHPDFNSNKTTEIHTLEEIIKDIYALYNFEKAGEGMDSYNQKWRNSGYIRFNFMYTEDTDLTSESINLKKEIKTIFGRHGEETGWELCVIDDRGNRY